MFEDLLHYLDDYFTLGPANTDVCAQQLISIKQTAKMLGIPLSPGKCEGPATCLVFLGIELDTVEMTARLPQEKLAGLVELIRIGANKKWCKPKELQSLIGKLNHACAVMPQGRTLMRRLLDLLRGKKSFKTDCSLKQSLSRGHCMVASSHPKLERN